MIKKRSNAYKKAVEQYDLSQKFSLKDAIEMVKSISFARFDETITVDVALGVDPRHADQMVRGTVTLPQGTGKNVKVLAIVSPEKEEEAEGAGADHIGGEEIVSKIKGGWLDFDVVVTSPDMMRHVGQLGKILGPRGMMPNPKVGTVTPNIGSAVKEIKSGRLEYKVDKYGLIHLPIGKRSFQEAQLFENAATILDTLIRVKPASSKGIYMKSVTLSPVMGPGVKVDPALIRAEIESVKAALLS
jgi:large subunit ribosomal protein L1